MGKPPPKKRSNVSRIFLSILVNAVILTAVLLFTPGLPPNIRFESYKLAPPQKLEGKLAPNNILDNAELIFDGKFIGPESLAVRGNEIFTGVKGGRVIRIKGEEITTVARFGQTCDNTWDDAVCGRPLGMRFDRNGKLIVADAYFGLFRVDVDSGKIETLVASGTPIDGKRPMIPDDLDISKDGMIYWSDASTTTSLHSAVVEYLGGPTGRLLKYDPDTNASEVLMNGLHFPNGVQLSKNEDFVMVAETMRARVWRYFLKGEKKGQHEIFVDGLPGLPDNIRSNGRGGYYISLVTFRDKTRLSPGDSFGGLPLIRKLILRAQGLALHFFDWIDDYISNSFVSSIKYYVGHLGPFGAPADGPKKVIIVEIDEDGKIIGSLQTQNGPMKIVTEVSVTDKYTYFGSYVEPKLWRIPTKELRQKN